MKGHQCCSKIGRVSNLGTTPPNTRHGECRIFARCQLKSKMLSCITEVTHRTTSAGAIRRHSIHSSRWLWPRCRNADRYLHLFGSWKFGLNSEVVLRIRAMVALIDVSIPGVSYSIVSFAAGALSMKELISFGCLSKLWERKARDSTARELCRRNLSFWSSMTTVSTWH